MNDEISDIKRRAGISEGRRFKVTSEEMYDLATAIGSARRYLQMGDTDSADEILHRASSMAQHLMSRS